MHIIAYKIRYFQFTIAVAKCYILLDSAQGMPHHWLSREAGLGQYTDEENPAHAQNAADSVNFLQNIHTACYTQSESYLIGVTSLT